MRRGSILIADDDEPLLEALAARFRDEGYSVTTATNGRLAVAQAALHCCDAIVLDINMPFGDGFDVHERLQKMVGGGSVPVIYLTGERSGRVEALSKLLGAFALIHKPFDTDRLLATVESAVNER